VEGDSVTASKNGLLQEAPLLAIAARPGAAAEEPAPFAALQQDLLKPRGGHKLLACADSCGPPRREPSQTGQAPGQWYQPLQRHRQSDTVFLGSM
jgi:hypothetical protein